MKRFKAKDLDVLEKCIREVEARTRAEVVLVIRGASGNYRDIDWLFGAAVALGVLCVYLFSPYEARPIQVPFGMAAAFFIAGWLCRKSKLRRVLTRRKRRETQVRHAAWALFHEKKVDRTHGHAGVLVYFSVLERMGELVIDPGIAPYFTVELLTMLRSSLETACVKGDPTEAIGGVLRTLGVHLGKVAPFEGSTQEFDLDARPDIDPDAEDDA